jgi:hypothetical protein
MISRRQWERGNEMVIQQKWWNSPVTLTAIFTQVLLIAGLFLTVENLNVLQVIGTSVIAIIAVIAAVNNSTNPVGWGANVVK